MLKIIATRLIQNAERRLGVGLDYTHHIAQTSVSLLMRYNRLFGFLDPNNNVPREAYHAARIRGALAADCGTCVEAELNLAKANHIPKDHLKRILMTDYASLPNEIAAVCLLADSVVSKREDNPEARSIVVKAYGDAGLIELSYAMNGASLLPGIKRSKGYATACNIELMQGKL